MALTVAEYMNLKCVCGALRSMHYHAHPVIIDPAADGVMRIDPDKFMVQGPNCDGFIWEMEKEFGGNPLANPHLRPLMVDAS